MINIQNVHMNGDVVLDDSTRIQELLELNTSLSLVTVARKIFNAINGNINMFMVYVYQEMSSIVPFLKHFNINFKLI